jgi:Flp pilus assembly protein TadG
MTRRFAPRRRGSVVTESIVVVPVLLALILGTLVGGYGVFRYQQIALLAREGARYASVHGGQYQLETGNAAATPQDVYNNAILPYAVNLDLSQLSCTVTWNSNNMPSSVNSDYEKPTGNTVTVTVNYKWFPEAYVIGPIVLSSTSTMPMAY